MDAFARRRELRKRKILQNAEDRIKKLTGNIGAYLKHDENVEKPTEYSKGSSETLDSGQTNVHNSSSKFDQTFEVTANKENILDQSSLNDDPKEVQDKTDGHVTKEIVHETVEQQIDKNKENDMNSEANIVGSKISMVRSVIVIVFAALCFTKSLYMPVISSTFGSPWFLEMCNVKESSFLIPFCLLEIFLFFAPSMRKVTPGKQVNIWLLALKLCGVSPVITDSFKLVILEILEFLTDLAMFIFVLVVLQNGKELQLPSNSNKV